MLLCLQNFQFFDSKFIPKYFLEFLTRSMTNQTNFMLPIDKEFYAAGR